MFCTQCGTEMGDRATCPACGAPAPRGTDAWQPATGPVDEAGGTTPPGTDPDPTLVTPVPAGPDGAGPPTGTGDATTTTGGDEPPRRRTPLVIAAVVVVALIAGVVGFLVLGGGDDEGDAGAGAAPTTTVAEREATTSTTEEPTTTTTLPDEVPDLTGLTFDEAEAKVEGTGITLKAVNVADEDAPSGTIVGQKPEAGAPYEDRVVVQIARPAVRTYLADLEPVEGDGPNTEQQTVNATTYTHALSFDVCGSFDDVYTYTVGYDLGRKYLTLTGAVGVSDVSPSGSKVKFEVLADGRKIAETTAGLGETKPLDLDVTGVLRLKLVTTGIASDESDCTGVWADLQMTSPPDAEDSPVSTTTTP